MESFRRGVEGHGKFKPGRLMGVHNREAVAPSSPTLPQRLRWVNVFTPLQP